MASGHISHIYRPIAQLTPKQKLKATSKQNAKRLWFTIVAIPIMKVSWQQKPSGIALT